MTTGAIFFSGAAASPGNGVTPFAVNFGALALSGADEPNIRCHKLGFAAGSGTGNSTTATGSLGVALGAVTILGAGATCTICGAVKLSERTGAELLLPA